jgi:hypothetical protein
MTAWVKDDTSASILWLSGKPGAGNILVHTLFALLLIDMAIGKSVMCSYVVDMLARVRQLDFCYYFCNNQDDGNDNPSEQILATIAIQLLRAHRELSSLITNEFVSRGLSSGLTQLRVLVPKLLEMQPYTRIVVDGIDECSKGGQKALLNELRATCGHETRCKILISSRKEPGIRDILDGKPKISLDKNDKVESDIQRYISHKIQDLQSSFDGQFESEVFNKIASLLAEKADGEYSQASKYTSALNSL